MATTENYIIKDGQVFVSASPWFEERIIGELPEKNQQHILSSMQERFEELVETINEFQKEFDQASDKIKLAGKLARNKSYICTAKAIGDYHSLLSKIDKLEAIIQKDIEDVLNKKEIICKHTEDLLESKEWKESTDKLRDLQKEFKELPTVPDLKNEELKIRLEKAIEDFFKRKQASFESFEQDLLDNLDKKMELCEKAEALANSTDWKKTTEAYQELNEAWKKIGMVPKHRVEELWFKFSTAKDIFFNNKKLHFEEIKAEQSDNLVKKTELVQKAQALQESKDWKKTTEAFTELMEEWKKIGRVAHEKNDEIWNQFLEAKNHFFLQKEAHYSGVKVQLEDNYAKKIAIVQHAEELQNTLDFDHATQEYMDMFEEWKKIGRIPKEYGDEPWERFMKAKKNFFDRKDANREKRKQEISKDIQERIARNRNFYNKVNRELQREEELLFDVQDRLQNLPATLRSYEKREELKDMVLEIEQKINQLKSKVKDIKDKIHQDEREINYLLRAPKKKENTKNEKSEKKEIEPIAVSDDSLSETPNSESNQQSDAENLKSEPLDTNN